MLKVLLGAMKVTLQAAALRHRLHGNCFPTVREALAAAKRAAAADDLVFVGGSTFVVADLLRDCYPSIG